MIRIRGVACRDENESYERAQQELLDAFIEGRRVGLLNCAIALNPFDAFEPEHHEWIRGWHEARGIILSHRRVA